MAFLYLTLFVSTQFSVYSLIEISVQQSQEAQIAHNKAHLASKILTPAERKKHLKG